MTSVLAPGGHGHHGIARVVHRQPTNGVEDDTVDLHRRERTMLSALETSQTAFRSRVH
ncbi:MULTISPECIES: hypothetical protein [unclassified Streptomyces]|uniref:hypothetical protein n=1 Tax=unclassified Streptomyces TaxID=2593676 RepID=UPI0036E5AC8F